MGGCYFPGRREKERGESERVRKEKDYKYKSGRKVQILTIGFKGDGLNKAKVLCLMASGLLRVSNMLNIDTDYPKSRLWCAVFSKFILPWKLFFVDCLWNLKSTACVLRNVSEYPKLKAKKTRRTQ